jgi:hypothetical protein
VIAHLGIVGQGLETMGEARWDIQCRTIVGAEFYAGPLAPRRRTQPQVHGYIKDRASRARDELDLFLGRSLEV